VNKKPIPFSETELVALLKNNDKMAFEYLYDRYAPAIFAIVGKILKDQDKAADVTQDAFLKIWRNIKGYNSEKSTLFTWMLNVARNTAIDALRTDFKFKNHLGLEVISNYDLNVASASNSLDISMDVKSLVETLEPQIREIVEMIYIQGYTHQETSEHLRLPLGTVKSRIRVSLREMKNLFGYGLIDLKIA
jgi:RNA polymerase sigma factor (sigma-70 family)